VILASWADWYALVITEYRIDAIVLFSNNHGTLFWCSMTYCYNLEQSPVNYCLDATDDSFKWSLNILTAK